MDENFGGKPFSYIHYLCVQSALAVNRPRDLVFHIAHEPSGKWWEAIRPAITIDRVEPPSTVFGRPVEHFAHRADVLRLQILRAEGGIYLDTDVFCVRPLAPLLGHGMVMGIEPGQGLCNAVMLAEPHAAFLGIWFEHYRDFDGRRWNAHSVRLPYRLAQAHPDLVHVLDEYAFFFPNHDDPSGARLWMDRLPPKEILRSLAKDVRRTVRRADPTLPQRRAALRAHALWSRERYYRQLRQSFCVHLWEKLWWDAYLQRLGPETLGSSEGLYPRLVEDVLGCAADGPATMRGVLEPALEPAAARRAAGG
jgi:hypothetical protein